MIKSQIALLTFHLLVLTASFLSLASCQSEDTNPNDTSQEQKDLATDRVIDDELQQLIDDMNEPHAAKPSGVPDIGWDTNPRIGYGNTPPEGWDAMMPWGQVYTDDTGDNTTNVRFQIKNLQTWYFSKKMGQWIEWKSASNTIGGANYNEDFADDISVTADIRPESSNVGGISSTLKPGYNFHFWADSRVKIDPDDITAVWSGVDARLILDDNDGKDERTEARMMMSVGADYWLSLDAAWDQWQTNGDIFIGRFRYITSEWQRFHAHTMTQEQILRSPLPPFRIEDNP